MKYVIYDLYTMSEDAFDKFVRHSSEAPELRPYFICLEMIKYFNECWYAHHNHLSAYPKIEVSELIRYKESISDTHKTFRLSDFEEAFEHVKCKSRGIYSNC